ncbi:DNA-binding transcriptional regulator, MerR family [Amycolatopsis arida]|uniref:DNA-binding transcriptional regulator, MerR family n=1 Tax=Amycolatopsis arida TaxID=587909 RepID=A0A1I5R6D4_9PSEU|nr:MerR family transcriptional regulator [Amycolatopsis arida]TDX99093.1 DNA-binding transcriptional MerR regulator [Amycolatopsis arida]SFP53940.1 DNA-binding transcriptional regulator, MerR family [Amycolatopsis arida]
MASLFTIGELARRTGLSVKTIRFYSDSGLLPPTERTRAGYRLYDAAALARLEYVRTLRELGLGLDDVERALAREDGVARLAARHVEALDEQIRRLRLRRAVLRAVAKRGSGPAEVRLMNQLATMPDEERKRLLDEFWDEVSAGLDVDGEFYAWMRSAKPELPDDPSPEQLEAWIELAELVRDPDFRRLIRGMSETNAAARAAGEPLAVSAEQQEQWFGWLERARVAVDAGLPPDSPEARALADEIASTWDEGMPRTKLADRVTAGADERAERYWRLLAVINSWPPVPERHHAAHWIADALRHST